MCIMNTNITHHEIMSPDVHQFHSQSSIGRLEPSPCVTTFLRQSIRYHNQSYTHTHRYFTERCADHISKRNIHVEFYSSLNESKQKHSLLIHLGSYFQEIAFYNNVQSNDGHLPES